MNLKKVFVVTSSVPGGVRNLESRRIVVTGIGTTSDVRDTDPRYSNKVTGGGRRSCDRDGEGFKTPPCVERHKGILCGPTDCPTEAGGCDEDGSKCTTDREGCVDLGEDGRVTPTYVEVRGDPFIHLSSSPFR